MKDVMRNVIAALIIAVGFAVGAYIHSDHNRYSVGIYGKDNLGLYKVDRKTGDVWLRSRANLPLDDPFKWMQVK